VSTVGCDDERVVRITFAITSARHRRVREPARQSRGKRFRVGGDLSPGQQGPNSNANAGARHVPARAACAPRAKHIGMSVISRRVTPVGGREGFEHLCLIAEISTPKCLDECRAASPSAQQSGVGSTLNLIGGTRSIKASTTQDTNVDTTDLGSKNVVSHRAVDTVWHVPNAVAIEKSQYFHAYAVDGAPLAKSRSVPRRIATPR
jgi:hypothetical protein